MYGAIARAAVYTPIAVFFSLIIEAILGVATDIMKGGQNSDALALRAVETVEANFLALCIVSLLLMVLGRAVVEKRMAR